ncbi:MAG: hypothetical protein LBT03_03020 [Holosporales bacterium]|jgi:F0F1-type ATP synthase epsilon subunit|nr:hypothetical protein [Holosporales bacterium]
MLDFLLICDEREKFCGKSKAVFVNTSKGEINILPGHEPLITRISGDIMYIGEDSLKYELMVEEGFMYTNGKMCVIVASHF